MVYSLEEIRERVMPVAKKYGLKAVFLFGSYARGEASEESDIDLLVDTAGTDVRGLFALGALYCDLEETLQKKVDLITMGAVEQEAQMAGQAAFCEEVLRERVNVYNAVA